MLPISKHKLKAGDMASILKNRKTDNRSSENVPESVCLEKSVSVNMENDKLQ